jgi:uncharacterized RDD family membrane protein YckC
MEQTEVRYAGFWVRFVASFLDTLFLAVPIGAVIYLLSDGEWFDFTAYTENMRYAMHGNAVQALSHLPRTELKWEMIFELSVMASVIVFWRRWKGATPGKHLVGITVVDAKSFGEITNAQAVIRTIGYIASTLMLLMGFLMVAFREDKRALHDLMAGTAVIYHPNKDAAAS